jgi:ADP-ribosylglycohydrolase
MLGAIAGDVIGSVYEWQSVKTTDFPLFSPGSRFTDDSVLTVAVADALLSGRDYADCLRDWGCRFPRAGYGQSFHRWLQTPCAGPYNSWGNGSAMRVSPVGWAFDDIDQVLAEARRSAAVTHDHPEGIKGAQAVALAILLARKGEDQATIKKEVGARFGYDLDRRLEDIRPDYHFDVSCQGSVPEAIIAFLEAHDFESAVRNAVSLGGDADTQGCIAGAIAAAHYRGVPEWIRHTVTTRLDKSMVAVLNDFEQQFGY